MSAPWVALARGRLQRQSHQERVTGSGQGQRDHSHPAPGSDHSGRIPSDQRTAGNHGRPVRNRRGRTFDLDGRRQGDPAQDRRLHGDGTQGRRTGEQRLPPQGFGVPAPWPRCRGQLLLGAAFGGGQARASLHGDLFAGQLPSRRSDPRLRRPADRRPVAVPALRRGGRPVHDRGRVFQLPARVGGHAAAGGGRRADPCLSRPDERREATGAEPAFGTHRGRTDLAGFEQGDSQEARPTGGQVQAHLGKGRDAGHRHRPGPPTCCRWVSTSIVSD